MLMVSHTCLFISNFGNVMEVSELKTRVSELEKKAEK